MNLYAIKTCVVRYLYTMRDYSRLFELLFWPMIDIGWLGLIALWSGGLSDNPGLIRVFVMALVLWQVVYRAHYEVCFNLLDEVIDRNLVNMVASPLKKREWIVAMMVSGAFKSCFALLYGSFVGFLFFGVNVFSMGPMLLPFFILCIISGWIIGFLSAGLVILKGGKLQQIPWIAIMLVAVLSAVFYPTEILPNTLQILAKGFPMSYIFEGMRELVQQGTLSLHYLWMSSLLSLFYLSLSLSFFLWMYEKSRKIGLDRLA